MFLIILYAPPLRFPVTFSPASVSRRTDFQPFSFLPRVKQPATRGRGVSTRRTSPGFPLTNPKQMLYYSIIQTPSPMPNFILLLSPVVTLFSSPALNYQLRQNVIQTQTNQTQSPADAIKNAVFHPIATTTDYETNQTHCPTPPPFTLSPPHPIRYTEPLP